jgi:hypothetical protein
MYEVMPHNNCTSKKYKQKKNIDTREFKIRTLTQEYSLCTFRLIIKCIIQTTS